MARRKKRINRRKRRGVGKCPFGVKNDGTPIIAGLPTISVEGEFLDVTPIPDEIQKSVSEIMKKYGLSKID